MQTVKLPHNHSAEENTQRIMEKIPKIETVSAVAETMKQLSDPSRLRIFWFLCHTEECVVNIAAMMNMSSPAVAHHLRILKDARLLTARHSGKEVFYKTSDEPIVGVLYEAIESIGSIARPGNETNYAQNDPETH